MELNIANLSNNDLTFLLNRLGVRKSIAVRKTCSLIHIPSGKTVGLISDTVMSVDTDRIRYLDNERIGS